MKVAQKYLPEGWINIESNFEGEIDVVNEEQYEDEDSPSVLFLSFNPTDGYAEIRKFFGRSATNLTIPWDGNRSSMAAIIRRAERESRSWRKGDRFE